MTQITTLIVCNLHSNFQKLLKTEFSSPTIGLRKSGNKNAKLKEKYIHSSITNFNVSFLTKKTYAFSSEFNYPCQQVATISLSISSSCNKFDKIRLVATCHLQTYYNLLKQVVTSLLTVNLQQTCCNKLSQALRTHPDIDLL